VKRNAAAYAPLSVVGLEVEYAVVDGDLRPACVVADAFREASGRAASDVSRGRIGFSNELAAHVLELKMMRPSADLRQMESDLHDGVVYFSGLLRERFGARLLPTAMHPLMKPSETRLWSRGGRAVYDAYARTFDVRTHGWLNIQSTHVNLPFGRTERDVVDLYNAVACLLPYLPALAASSPVVEGRTRRHVDNRLYYYRTNQERIPRLPATSCRRFSIRSGSITPPCCGRSIVRCATSPEPMSCAASGSIRVERSSAFSARRSRSASSTCRSAFAWTSPLPPSRVRRCGG
jgi:carboxylate-amine ligase